MSGREKGRYGRLINNTAIIAAGQIGSKMLVYLLVRLYTSVMSKTEYSIASNITEMATLLIPVISLGIGEAVFRFAMDKAYSKKDVFTSGYVAFGLGALLLGIVIPVLCSIPYFDGLVWLIVVYIISSVLHTICSQFIRARTQFKLYAVQGLLNTLLTIIFNIIFLIPLHMSYVGYVLSVAVADFLTMLFIFIGARLYKELDLGKVRAGTLKAMLRFSIPMIPATIFWWVTNVSDRFMITAMVGDEINGLYSAAYKIPTLLMVISGVFVNAWRNSAIDEHNKTGYRSFYSAVFDAFSGIIFILASGIIAFTFVITFLMFAPAYHEAWLYIPVLTCAMIFFNLVSFLGSIYIVAKKTVWSLITSLAGAVLNVTANLLLIPVWGASGAAAATAVSFVLVFVLRIITTRKYIYFHVNFTKLAVNSLLVGIQTASIMLRLPGWFVLEALCLIAVTAINAPPFLRALIKMKRKKDVKKF